MDTCKICGGEAPDHIDSRHQRLHEDCLIAYVAHELSANGTAFRDRVRDNVSPWWNIRHDLPPEVLVSDGDEEQG